MKDNKIRKTYIDNNGFERYEDTGKLVINGNHFYTDKMIAQELSGGPKPKNIIYDFVGCDYESLILARQEQFMD